MGKYNPQIQVFAMKQKYPQFKSKIVDKSIIFIGDLLVKLEFPIYKVSIEYRENLSPIVRVLSPELVDKAPHVYKDKRLCLYHPENFKWRKEKLIANEIVEWTASWIYFYEVWLETTKWYGPEAVHNIEKLEDE
ncbi:hypothetical protein [Sphingobacterium kitahiroshimense]|uniref:Type II CBASS E2 protein domain-containing protein n=1 Tax=Sphingobacterium kitahiroshimense TaxID=470446 RepID=A0ABV0C267_9SPHI